MFTSLGRAVSVTVTLWLAFIPSWAHAPAKDAGPFHVRAGGGSFPSISLLPRLREPCGWI